MSDTDPVLSTVQAITSSTIQYAPMAIAGIQAAEVAVNASGTDKKAAVLNGILAGVQAGAKAGEQVAQPQVAAISGLIDLFVSIFNALGLFSHKA